MFKIEFESLNEAIEKLPYARVYQSPMHRETEFCIEVRHGKGGNYEALQELIKLAEKDGFKYLKYYEMADFNGNYHYTATMYVDEGRINIFGNKVSVYKGD